MTTFGSGTSGDRLIFLFDNPPGPHNAEWMRQAYMKAAPSRQECVGEWTSFRSESKVSEPTIPDITPGKIENRFPADVCFVCGTPLTPETTVFTPWYDPMLDHTHMPTCGKHEEQQ